MKINQIMLDGMKAPAPVIETAEGISVMLRSVNPLMDLEGMRIRSTDGTVYTVTYVTRSIFMGMMRYTLSLDKS